MAKYESSVKQVNAPVERVYAVLSDMERLRPMIEIAQNNADLQMRNIMKAMGFNTVAIRFSKDNK